MSVKKGHYFGPIKAGAGQGFNDSGVDKFRNNHSL